MNTAHFQGFRFFSTYHQGSVQKQQHITSSGYVTTRNKQMTWNIYNTKTRCITSRCYCILRPWRVEQFASQSPLTYMKPYTWKKTNKISCLLKQSCNLATENHAVRNLPKHLNDEVEEKAGNIIPFLGNSPTPKTPATNEMTSFGSPDLRNWWRHWLCRTRMRMTV